MTGLNYFETENNLYQVNVESGLATVASGVSTPVIFIGSLRPNTKVSIGDKCYGTIGDEDSLLQSAIFTNIMDESASNFFVPELREGWYAFGMGLFRDDINYVSRNGVNSNFLLSRENVHGKITSEIKKIHNRITPPYNVRD